MAIKKSKAQAVTMNFTPAGEGAEKLLANAELVFNTGLLRGTRLTGFALWRAHGENGAFISVTLPARPNGTQYFDLLRAVDGDGRVIRKLKATIVKEYQRQMAVVGKSPEASDTALVAEEDVPF